MTNSEDLTIVIWIDMLLLIVIWVVSGAMEVCLSTHHGGGVVGISQVQERWTTVGKMHMLAFMAMEMDRSLSLGTIYQDLETIH